MSAPVVLRGGGLDVAALLDVPPPGGARDTAVLLVPPWGWEEVASARARRTWARRLADAGLPALRLDLPGCGDSAGGPRHPGLADAWIDAVGDGVAWLRGLDGVTRVAVIGLGLGGLLARAAVRRGAPAEVVVTWGEPVGGRAWVRATGVFARMEGLSTAVPGGILAGGHLLADETAAVLCELRAEPPVGVPVCDLPAAGWAAMTDHPETSVLPPESLVADRLLLDGSAPTTAAPAAPPARPLTLDDGTGIERPVRLPGPSGRLAAVLTDPARPAGGPRVVLLSAGAVRHTGPNRLWVDAARRLAAVGVASARVDLAGLGEADAARPEGPWQTAELYETDGDAQVAAILDGLGLAPDDVLLAGLCSGGYWAVRAAAAGRAREVVAVNPGALVWDRAAPARDEVRRLARLADPAWWGKLARGGVDLRAERFQALAGAVRHGGARRAAGDRDAQLADLLARAGAQARVALAFAEGEPVLDELRRAGLAERPPAGVELLPLPGGDHTLRPADAQAALLALLEARAAHTAVLAG